MARFTLANRAPLLDAALALGLLLSSVAQGSGYLFDGRVESKMARALGSVDDWHRAIALWWVCAGLIPAGMLLARSRPLPALGLAALGAAGHQVDRLIPVPLIDFVVLILLYRLASRARSRWVPVCALAVLVAGDLLIALWQPSLPEAIAIPAKKPPATLSGGWDILHAVAGSGTTAEVLLMLVLAAALGDGARTRHAHLRMLEQRAADLESEQQQRAALAASAERARITRELHDVVAHGLSVMVVQAQGAAAALRRHPERTEAALANVIATGRGSLAEMRRLLGVVRRDPAEDPQLAPQPGVASLPGLVDQVRAAGTAVALAIEGEPVPLPAGVDLSGYRIVQESLTNTIKHAGPGASARVLVAFRPGGLEIEVSDDGSGRPAADGRGSGLIGLSERVDVLGGTLAAGPAGTGWRVRAVLPLPIPAEGAGGPAGAAGVAGQPEAAAPSKVPPAVWSPA